MRNCMYFSDFTLLMWISWPISWPQNCEICKEEEIPHPTVCYKYHNIEKSPQFEIQLDFMDYRVIGHKIRVRSVKSEEYIQFRMQRCIGESRTMSLGKSWKSTWISRDIHIINWKSDSSLYRVYNLCDIGRVVIKLQRFKVSPRIHIKKKMKVANAGVAFF